MSQRNIDSRPVHLPIRRAASNAVAAAALLASLVSTHAQAIALSLAPVSQSVAVGSPTSVNIVISDLSAASVGAYDIDLAFNAAIIGFNNARFGTQLDLGGTGSSQQIVPGAGTINLAEVSFDPAALLDASQLDSFTLATLAFIGLAPGTSALTLTLNALGDSGGGALGASITNAAITVTSGSTVPEPNTTLLILAGALLLCASAGRRKH